LIEYALDAIREAPLAGAHVTTAAQLVLGTPAAS
jgi:hypothetical protein